MSGDQPTISGNFETGPFTTGPAVKIAPRDFKELVEHTREQTQNLVAGDTTLAWELLTQLSNERLFTLGSIGRFFHPDYGLILARYVAFTRCSQLVNPGNCYGILLAQNDFSWKATNQIDLSHPDLVLGVGASYQIPQENQFGWLIVSGANIQTYRFNSTLVPRPLDALAWNGYSTNAKVAKIFAIGKVVSEGLGTWAAKPGSLLIDITGGAGQSNPQLETRIAALETKLVQLQESMASAADQNRISQAIAEQRLQLNSINTSLDIYSARLATIDGDTILAQVGQQINLVQSYVDYVTSAAGVIDGLRQEVHVNLTASQAENSAAKIWRDEAGQYALSASERSNEATVQSNEALVQAIVSQGWAASASASASEASTYAALAASYTTGVSGAAFYDAFDYPDLTAFHARWEDENSVSPNIYVISNTESGGRSLQMGDNSGNDRIVYRTTTDIPYDANETYYIDVDYEIPVTSTGGVYLGVEPFNNAGVKLNCDTILMAAVAVNNGSQSVTGRFKVRRYFGGRAAVGAGNNVGIPSANVAAPSRLPSNTVIIRPAIGAQYPDQTGQIIMHSMRIGVVPKGGDIPEIATNAASIVSEAAARASADSALATSITTLNATVAGQSATITSLSSVTATHTGQLTTLNAKYSVKLDVNGRVSGFELNSGGAVSVAAFNADAFRIGKVGGTDKVVFDLDTVNDRLNLNADLYLGNGRIVWTNGAYMKVSGVGFGTSSQFLEWFGPTMAINATSEATAISYLKTDGSAYFGGSLTAGALTTAVQTSSTANNAEVETAVFGSNGGTITVTLSYTYSALDLRNYGPTQASNWNTDKNSYSPLPTDPDSDGVFTANASESSPTTVQLYRSINGGAYALVATLSVTGTRAWEGESPNGSDPGFSRRTANNSGSLTYTDPTNNTQDRQYKAVISSRTASVTLNIMQRIAVIAVEP